jgi:hypothetical protein
LKTIAENTKLESDELREASQFEEKNTQLCAKLDHLKAEFEKINLEAKLHDETIKKW